MIKSLHLEYVCLIGLINLIIFTKSTKPEVNATNFIGAYYSFADVKEGLENCQGNPRDKWAGDKMMTTYYNFVSTLPPENDTVRRFPFFVVEGNHRIRKYIVARKLARYIYAANLVNPPEFLSSFKTYFSTVTGKRAFYTLGHYANAHYARILLERRPVVTAGYWLDIAAFTLAKKYPESFPPWGSDEMKWPDDLLMPDLIFYINTPYKHQVVEGTTKQPNPLRQRLVELYQQWQRPKIIEINRMYADNEMFDEIFRHVNHIKNTMYKNDVQHYNKN